MFLFYVKMSLNILEDYYRWAYNTYIIWLWGFYINNLLHRFQLIYFCSNIKITQQLMIIQYVGYRNIQGKKKAYILLQMWLINQVICRHIISFKRSCGQAIMPEELGSGYKKLLRMPEKVITASAATRKQQSNFTLLFTLLSALSLISELNPWTDFHSVCYATKWEDNRPTFIANRNEMAAPTF